MKKIQVCCALIFSLVAVLQARLPQEKQIKGKIKSIVLTEHYSVKRKNRWTKGKPKRIIKTFFNKKGIATEEIEIIKGEITRHLKFVFRDADASKSFCLEKLSSFKERATSFMQEAKGPVLDFCKNNKNKMKNIKYVLSVPLFSSEKPYPVKIVLSRLDKKGRKKKEFILNSMKELEETRLYKYKKSRKTMEIYDFEENLLQRKITEYNEVTRTRTTSVYDERGMLSKKTIVTYRSDMTILKKEIVLYDEGEQVLSRKLLTFDPTNNLREEWHYSAHSSEPLYGYRYFRKTDKMKNWIFERKEKIIMVYGKKMRDKNISPKFRTRKIEYYQKDKPKKAK